MEMPTPAKRSYSDECEPCIMQLANYYHRANWQPPPPRSPGGPRLTKTVEYTRNKLRALRLQPRKAGTGSKVRAEAITAIVNFYYGPQKESLRHRRILGIAN